MIPLLLILALVLAGPVHKPRKKQSARKPCKPLVYRCKPGMFDSPATGYYVEGQESGNGNNKKDTVQK